MGSTDQEENGNQIYRKLSRSLCMILFLTNYLRYSHMLINVGDRLFGAHCPPYQLDEAAPRHPCPPIDEAIHSL